MAVEGINCSEIFLRNISRDINGLSDENRNTRKRSLNAITQEFSGKKDQLTNDDYQKVLGEIIGPLVKGLSDPVEKCRFLVLEIISQTIPLVNDQPIFLSNILPVFVQRLGQVEIIEPSEEIRLSCIELMLKFLELCQQKISPFVDDYIRILQRSILDDYPEVKKASCRCAINLAVTVPPSFHVHSDSLVPSLLKATQHQHSRVRCIAIETLGATMQYGQCKILGDVVPHFAQRLFDNSIIVRSAVIQVVGDWLLDLVDRYSFHRQLIPLLLTGCTDEIQEIRDRANSLWNDVGLKYLGENEKELKDETDYSGVVEVIYPKHYVRPNLGCRKLMYHNFSKIMPGALNDITDWVPATRCKSAQLLYTMLVQQGENVVQHLDKMLAKLPQPAQDDNPIVREYVDKTCDLIGYFVDPKVWTKMMTDYLRLNGAPGSVRVLSGLLRGSNIHGESRDVSEDIGLVIIEALSESAFSQSIEEPMQCQMIDCLSNLMTSVDCKLHVVQLFRLILTLRSLAVNQNLLKQTHQLISDLGAHCGYSDSFELYRNHGPVIMSQLKKNFTTWTKYTVERSIFEAFIVDAGPIISEMIEDVVPMLIENLQPTKNPEMRLKFFTLLSKLLVEGVLFSSGADRHEKLTMVIKDAILPNFVWRAGKVEKVLRKTAVTCLYALLENDVLVKVHLEPILDDLLTQLFSTLDDDESSTRLLGIHCLTRVFLLVGNVIDSRRLHNMYPDLLKRLDDADDINRCDVAAKLWPAYLASFGDDYEKNLYSSHLLEMYKGLLIHMDDKDPTVQQSVFEALMVAGEIDKECLLRELTTVRDRHRSPIYCDKLRDHLKKTA